MAFTTGVYYTPLKRGFRSSSINSTGFSLSFNKDHMHDSVQPQSSPSVLLMLLCDIASSLLSAKVFVFLLPPRMGLEKAMSSSW